MLEIALIDDEQSWHNIFVNKLKSFFQEDIRVDSFFDGESLFEKSRPYDVVFFDVELGKNKEDGLSLCKKYKTMYPEQKHIAIILTTHTELGRYGYLSNAFRYIDKLNLDEELEEAVHAVELIRGNEKSIQFNFDKIGVEDVIVDSIVCAETERRKVILRLNNGESFYIKNNYSEITDTLKTYGFYEIRKGIIINMKYVTDVIDDYLLLKGIKTKYYISRRKQREFVDVFIKWRMDRASG
ncbi:MAG: LytTR family transcriptional regulator DNA-binding domain-containing protein [Lachnospiraceae bacterium]|nr:LytTR family transcriptional regulator DNA-binding domain-containing protein [Lachnospiraceae bacterium]